MSTEEQTGLQALERLPPTVPMPPGRAERPESASLRHGPPCLMAPCPVATGAVVAPAIGASRTEEEGAAPMAQPLATAPEAPGLLSTDQRNRHQSAALGRLVAREGDSKEEGGEQEHRGVLKSRPTRAECLRETAHRLQGVSTPKQTSGLPQIAMWFSIVVRRLLKRGSFPSTEDVRTRTMAFMHYCNKTMAKPCKWTSTGRPLMA
jgi:hypothetical protein